MYCHGFWVGSGEARRINNAGLCLQIEEQVSISTRHAYLEIEFSLPPEIGAASYRMPVYVNSVSGDEMKLSFVDYGQDNLARLREQLRAIERLLQVFDIRGLNAQVA
jgi:hypothetical protein